VSCFDWFFWWVVEMLCCVQFVPDLIEAAPKIPEDLRKNTREIVALRCLEDFFCHNNEITNDVPSKEPKVTFDLSESSEDVLQSILQEVILFTISAFTCKQFGFEAALIV
jgi:hypothetical protein